MSSGIRLFIGERGGIIFLAQRTDRHTRIGCHLCERYSRGEWKYCVLKFHNQSVRIIQLSNGMTTECWVFGPDRTISVRENTGQFKSFPILNDSRRALAGYLHAGFDDN